VSRFRHHLFCCQNVRPEGSRPCCGARGGAEVLQAFVRRLLREPGLGEGTAITGCGCLGPCFDGPMVVVYPDGVWYRGVTPADVDEIVEAHLVGGRPVERLMYRWPDDD
jgi:(2Fe-2S) ferredoxin